MKTEKLMKPIRIISHLRNEINMADKAIVIIIAAFLSATFALSIGDFNLNVFLLSMSLLALILFWPNITLGLKTIPSTPEGSAGICFLIGIIGMAVLFIIILLTR